MTATFKQFLSRLVRAPENPDAQVHFHSGPEGAPAVCHDPTCPSPRLEI